MNTDRIKGRISKEQPSLYLLSIRVYLCLSVADMLLNEAGA